MRFNLLACLLAYKHRDLKNGVCAWLYVFSICFLQVIWQRNVKMNRVSSGINRSYDKYME